VSGKKTGGGKQERAHGKGEKENQLCPSLSASEKGKKGGKQKREHERGKKENQLCPSSSPGSPGPPWCTQAQK